MLEKFLTGNASVKLKKKALFVLSQGGSPRARQVVTEIARGQRNPQLQGEALKYLGLFGGEQSRQALAEIYASTSDVGVKKQVLHSFMLSGDKARVLAAARAREGPRAARRGGQDPRHHGRHGRSCGSSTRPRPSVPRAQGHPARAVHRRRGGPAGGGAAHRA